MGGVGVHSRVPDKGDGGSREREWERLARHPLPEAACLAFGDGGDQIRFAGESEGRGEGADSDGDFAGTAYGFIDLLIQGVVAGEGDVAGFGVEGNGESRFIAGDGDEAVVEERLGAEFGICRRADDSGFEVGRAVAQGGAVLFPLLFEG